MSIIDVWLLLADTLCLVWWRIWYINIHRGFPPWVFRNKCNASFINKIYWLGAKVAFCANSVTQSNKRGKTCTDTLHPNFGMLFSFCYHRKIHAKNKITRSPQPHTIHGALINCGQTGHCIYALTCTFSHVFDKRVKMMILCFHHWDSLI